MAWMGPAGKGDEVWVGFLDFAALVADAVAGFLDAFEGAG